MLYCQISETLEQRATFLDDLILMHISLVLWSKQLIFFDTICHLDDFVTSSPAGRVPLNAVHTFMLCLITTLWICLQIFVQFTVHKASPPSTVRACHFDILLSSSPHRTCFNAECCSCCLFLPRSFDTNYPWSNWHRSRSLKRRFVYTYSPHWTCSSAKRRSCCLLLTRILDMIWIYIIVHKNWPVSCRTRMLRTTHVCRCTSSKKMCILPRKTTGAQYISDVLVAFFIVACRACSFVECRIRSCCLLSQVIGPMLRGP